MPSPPLPRSSLPALYQMLAPIYDPFAQWVSSTARKCALDCMGRPGGRVLVAGCGTGLSLPPLAQRWTTVREASSRDNSRRESSRRKCTRTMASLRTSASASGLACIEAIDASRAMLRRAFRRLSRLPGSQRIPIGDLEKFCAQTGGTDASDDEIDPFVRGFHVQNMRIVGRQADLFQLPFPPGWFRSVLCLYVLDLHSRSEIERALREFRRVLQPGGRMVVGTCAPAETRLELGWARLVDGLPFALGGGRPIDFPAIARGSRLDVVEITRVTQAGLASHITTLQCPVGPSTSVSVPCRPTP